MEIILNLYEMLKLSISCTRFKEFYSYTGRSSENKYSSSGRDEENERQDETQFTTKIVGKTSLGPSYCVL
jgi:hypothetical protein